MSRALGLHHISKKKQAPLRRLLSWLRKEKELDDLMIFIAIIYPLSIIPQAIKIIQIQDGDSISLLSFGLKMFFSLPWIAYGIKLKSKPIVVANVLWFIGYLAVFVEAWIY